MEFDWNWLEHAENRQLRVAAMAEVRRQAQALLDQMIGDDDRGQQIISYKTLDHGFWNNCRPVQFRSGPIEVYMSRQGETEFRPVHNIRYVPEADRIVIPRGQTNNFANWTPHDVLLWASHIPVSPENLDVLRLHNLNGLQVFFVTREENEDNRSFHFAVRSPESTRSVRLQAPIPPPDAPPLPDDLVRTMRLHINKLCNLLHGYR